MAATKNSYNTGVKVGNWVEDSAGSRLAKSAMLAHPKLETTEARSQYLNRFSELHQSKPAGIATDVLSGHLVMAHGPNIIDQTLPNDHYLTTTAAVFKGVKPHTVVGPKGKFEGDGNRVDLIAEKARLRAAGIDPWDPRAMSKMAELTAPRTVRHGGLAAAVIPVGTLGVRVSEQYTSVAGQVGADVGVIASVTALPPVTGFAREGSFTKSWARGCGGR